MSNVINTRKAIEGKILAAKSARERHYQHALRRQLENPDASGDWPRRRALGDFHSRRCSLTTAGQCLAMAFCRKIPRVLPRMA